MGLFSGIKNIYYAQTVLKNIGIDISSWGIGDALNNFVDRVKENMQEDGATLGSSIWAAIENSSESAVNGETADVTANPETAENTVQTETTAQAEAAASEHTDTNTEQAPHETGKAEGVSDEVHEAEGLPNAESYAEAEKTGQRVDEFLEEFADTDIASMDANSVQYDDGGAYYGV